MAKDMSWVRAALAGVGGFVVGAVAVITVWNQFPGVQRPFCQDWVTQGLFADAGWCAPQNRLVAPDQATTTIDAYLRHAGGPKPADGWAMLGEAETKNRSRDEYLAEWTEVARAERLAEPTLLGRGPNWFSVDYRVYRITEPGPNEEPNWQASTAAVDERRVEMKLQHTDDGEVVVVDIGDVQRTSGERVDLPWADFVVDTVTRRLPASGDTAAPRISQGKGLRVLCALDVDGQTWFSSYLGWFPESEVRLTEMPPTGVLECSPHLPTASAAPGG